MVTRGDVAVEVVAAAGARLSEMKRCPAVRQNADVMRTAVAVATTTETHGAEWVVPLAGEQRTALSFFFPFYCVLEKNFKSELLNKCCKMK